MIFMHVICLYMLQMYILLMYLISLKNKKIGIPIKENQQNQLG